MPQLDIIAFSSELTWFLIIFFGFFYVFISFFLPNIYFIFRVREKNKVKLSQFVEFTGEFTKNLDEVDFLDTEAGMRLEVNDNYLLLNPAKLFQDSVSKYGSIISKIDTENIRFFNSQRSTYYALAYFFLIPPFVEFTAFINSYSSLAKD